MGDVIEAFENQARYCDANDAPLTAALCRSLIGALGDRLRDWPGDPLRDALALRLIGGLHALWRRGLARELAPAIERGETLPPAAMRALLTAHETALLPWLDGPPQTNEPGRSAQLMAGLLEIVARHGPALEILELGSSAGLNLLIDRYRIELPGVATGPVSSPVRLRPEWRGPPPAGTPPRIVGIRGVDIAPVDGGSAAGAERLLAYVWADHPRRGARLADALALLRAHPPCLDRGDAPDWLAARLTEPEVEGVTRVVMHSIVWQYIAPEGRARITALMEAHGAAATSTRPLAWLRVEADRTLNQHDITLRSWPGHAVETLWGHAHAHGFWVERTSPNPPSAPGTHPSPH